MKHNSIKGLFYQSYRTCNSGKVPVSWVNITSLCFITLFPVNKFIDDLPILQVNKQVFNSVVFQKGLGPVKS